MGNLGIPSVTSLQGDISPQGEAFTSYENAPGVSAVRTRGRGDVSGGVGRLSHLSDFHFALGISLSHGHVFLNALPGQRPVVI